VKNRRIDGSSADGLVRRIHAPPPGRKADRRSCRQKPASRGSSAGLVPERPIECELHSAREG
jgi:hypothetical protein